MLKKVFIVSMLFCLPCFAQESEKINYYLGESKMTSPEGIYYGSSISLVKRTVSPDNNQITEDVISIDKKDVREYVTVFNVKKNDFTVSDNQKTFSGQGTFSGNSWNWDGWTYSAEMANSGGLVKGTDKIINDEIIVDKEYYQTKDKLTLKFKEVLKPISKEAFNILYTNLVTKKK